MDRPAIFGADHLSPTGSELQGVENKKILKLAHSKIQHSRLISLIA